MTQNLSFTFLFQSLIGVFAHYAIYAISEISAPDPLWKAYILQFRLHLYFDLQNLIEGRHSRLYCPSP